MSGPLGLLRKTIPHLLFLKNKFWGFQMKNPDVKRQFIFYFL